MIEVRDASPESEAAKSRLLARHTGFINQRKPAQYRVAPRDSHRECRCDPAYKPRFVNFPIQTRTLTLDLDSQDHGHLNKLVRMGQGQDAEDAFRTAVMTWYTRHKTRQIVPESLDL